MKIRRKATWYVDPGFSVEDSNLPSGTPPACGRCRYLSLTHGNLTYCKHKDAKGVAGTTENTGYVDAVQPRPQPAWCPLLPVPETYWLCRNCDTLFTDNVLWKHSQGVAKAICKTCKQPLELKTMV